MHSTMIIPQSVLMSMFLLSFYLCKPAYSKIITCGECKEYCNCQYFNNLPGNEKDILNEEACDHFVKI